MKASLKLEGRSGLRETAEDATEGEILAGILAASNDACWCMEFRVPVDITKSDNEVVRQVFENGPYWRFTNPAMARLYLLDPGIDFNSRPPSEIFPRSPQNEEYVLNLIANGFEVDAAPAVDRRYDGREIYVENDARAHIRDGKLLRMFGIVRDVGKHRRREAQIKHLLDSQVDILSSLPLGVVATGAEGNITSINRAAERLLGVHTADVFGSRFDALIGGAESPASVFESVVSGGVPREFEIANLHWSVAPRSTEGVVACVTALANGGSRS